MGVKWPGERVGIELGSKIQMNNSNWGVKWLPWQGWGGVIELGNTIQVRKWNLGVKWLGERMEIKLGSKIHVKWWNSGSKMASGVGVWELN